MLHTHTHPAGAGTTLKGKRKKKADTNDGQKDKTAQAGEGNRRTSRTNLHGEMDLNSTGHTPKPHNTLQRGTGEELGTDGGLVGDEGKTTRTIKLKGPSSTLGNRALLRTGTVVKSSHMGINSVSSSIELDARNVQPHQRTIKSKRTTPGKHGPVLLLRSVSKAGAAAIKKKFLIVQHGFDVKR